MTLKDVQKLMQQNIAMYRISEKALSREDAAAQLTIWAAALRDVPACAGQAAMQRAFAVCRFPVTLADLIGQLRAMQTAQSVTASECWDSLLKAARRAAGNEACYGYTFREADGRTQGQIAREKNQELFSDQHPAARAWLGGVHAFVELGRVDGEALRFQRMGFERAFAEYQAAAPLDTTLLALAAGSVQGRVEAGEKEA